MQAERPLDARLRRPDRHRRRGVRARCRARRHRQAGAAHGRQHGRPRRWRSASTAWTIPRACQPLRGLCAAARALSRAPPQDPPAADLPALARGGRRVPQAALRARPAGRPHQRPLLGVRLDAVALLDARCAALDPGRPLSPRPHRPGDAVARRHEPGGQGICRRPGRRRSRRAGAVEVRRRRPGADRGADRQSVRSRRDRRRHAPGAHHAAARAQRAACGAEEEGLPHDGGAYARTFIDALAARVGAARSPPDRSPHRLWRRGPPIRGRRSRRRPCPC